MATRAEHYKWAASIVENIGLYEYTSEEKVRVLLEAQVHATLATADRDVAR